MPKEVGGGRFKGEWGKGWIRIREASEAKRMGGGAVGGLSTLVYREKKGGGENVV